MCSREYAWQSLAQHGPLIAIRGSRIIKRSMLHTVVEMPEFCRCAENLGLTEEERANIIDAVAANPQAGNEIQGTGGARKIRFAAKRKGRGKSGGYRVITFYSGLGLPVFLITIYAKSEQDNLTQDQKKKLRTILKSVVEAYKEGKRDEQNW